MTTVAALYIDPRGPYPKMADVDCWDEARDARMYDGPYPVVAHPPCGPWGRLYKFSTRQDASCGPRAVQQVRQFGGILEHPEFSRLWREKRMPWPGEFADEYGGFTVALDQVGFGHPCRKRTWLYFVGQSMPDIDRAYLRAFDPFAEPTHVVSSLNGASLRLPELRGAKWRRAITPTAFAEWLVSLARSVNLDARRTA